MKATPGADAAGTSVLETLTSPLVAPGTDVPVQSPAEWVLLAATRREIGSDTETTVTVAAQIQTSQPLPTATATAPNLPPVVTIAMGTPNPDTGVLTGKLTAIDPEKKKLTYAIVGAAPPGLTFDTKTAAFTYTPTAVQRILSAVGTGSQAATFSVRVSDGVNTVDQAVDVPISPLSVTDAGAITIGGTGSGVVVSNTRAYVSNFGDNTITVIDTVKRSVIGTITLDSQAVGTALTPDGKKLYVATANLAAITVVNTVTNAITSYVQLQGRYADLLTVSADGKTLYALTDDETTGTPTATVTKIATSTGKVTGTVALPGADIVLDDNDDVTSFYSLIVSPDSKKVYVIADLKPAHEGATAVSALYTFASTAKTATLITQGDYFIEAALSPDGKRLYVNDAGAGKVLAFDTATNTVAGEFTNFSGGLGGITVSGDGSVLMAVYTNINAVVAFDLTAWNFGGAIKVVNVGVHTDGYYPGAVLSPDGKEYSYVADDGSLQVISLSSAGATRAIPAPVLRTANPVTGAVSGTVTDATGKKLTYTLVSGPDGGTFSFDKATGAFTYTPTAAQRVVAGLNPQANAAVFNVAVSDGETTVPVHVKIPISPITVSAAGLVPTGTGGGFAVAVTNTRAYVTNWSDRTIAVIDTIHGVLVTTVDVGAKPAGIAVSADGGKLFVANTTDRSVVTVDTLTGNIVNTIGLGDLTPTALTLSPDGKTIYVGTAKLDSAGQPIVAPFTNPAIATITKISTTTNKITGTLPAIGTVPQSIVISPDGKKIYVSSKVMNPITGQLDSAAVYVFSSSAKTATQINTVGNNPVALTVSPDNTKLYVTGSNSTLYTVETSKYAVVKTTGIGQAASALAFNKDGSLLLASGPQGLTVLDATTLTSYTGLILGSGMPGGLHISPDGQQAYTLTSAGVQLISLTPPNRFPTVINDTVNAPTGTGVVTGSIAIHDDDGDTVALSATTPANGTVVVNTDGTFTYTPTAAARHNAAATGATTDTFTVTIDDGRRGITYRDITVTILPANVEPTEKHTVGKPNSTTGVVTGTVTATDKDKDTLIYTISTPMNGAVTVTAKGGLTYTPTAQARHDAAAGGATTDSFTVTVTDRHGGTLDVPITVAISPTNTKPSVTAVAGQPDWKTGTVTVTLNATDADGDPVTFSNGSTTKGSYTVAGNVLTYAPTQLARDNAAKSGASAAVKADTLTVSYTDAHGATGTVSVKVAVSPTPPNHLPVASLTIGNPDATGGTVTGHLTATDADGDVLTYTITQAPSRADTFTFDASTGVFTYSPTAAARHAAAVSNGIKTDSFTITLNDGVGTVTVPITVAIAPSNAIPSNANYTASQPDPATGQVTGTITATDGDNDVLIYSGPAKSAKGGTVQVTAGNGFTYTPTAAARNTAAGTNASTADKTDTFTVTVSDGHGGTVAVPVTVAISPQAIVAVSFGSTPFSVPESNSGITTTSLTVKLSGPSAQTITVSYKVEAGGLSSLATPGVDFVAET
ncbi:MAG: hypothetical protein HYZ39_17465, partial [Mycolicibacterium cosmeticum]|nr:hypothetical protein [Mycolicibacterium cosmeticum]